MHLGNHLLTGRLSAVLQVPPALNRFTKAADKNLAETVFKLLLKYRPEDKAAKKQRLLSEVSKVQHMLNSGTATHLKCDSCHGWLHPCFVADCGIAVKV